MLSWNSFWLEMIQNPRVVKRNELEKTFPERVGNDGFFKMGFYVENLENLETVLKSRQVTFKYPMMVNDRFKMKLFIIQDPEGNMIQFFKFLH